MLFRSEGDTVDMSPMFHQINKGKAGITLNLKEPAGALNFAIGDPNAAVHGLVALFAALASRETTGRGCYIDLSQTEALFATLTPYTLQAQVEGRQPRPMGNAHPAMAPHGIYPAAGDDRWLSIAVRDDGDWAALGGVAGDRPWIADIRFAQSGDRIAARESLDKMVAAWTVTRDRDSLVAELRTAGVPASPVNDIEGVFNSSQIAARGMADKVDIPQYGPEVLFRAPWNISSVPIATGTRGPLVGEHNERVLRGTLGLSAEEFERLGAAGVIA